MTHNPIQPEVNSDGLDSPLTETQPIYPTTLELNNDVLSIIFSRVSFRDFITCSAVAKNWKILSDDSKFWVIFSDILNMGLFKKKKFEILQVKSDINEIWNRFKLCKESEINLTDLHNLACFGFKEFDECLDLTEKKWVKNNNELNGVYYSWAFKYLAIGNYKNVEKLMLKMIGVTKGVIAYELIKNYVNKHNFDKALSLISFTTSIEKQKSYYLIVESIKKYRGFDYLIKTLKELNSSNPESKKLISCIRAVEYEYRTTKESDKSKLLKSKFPLAFEDKNKGLEILYFIDNNQLDIAEEIFHSLTSTPFYEKRHFLNAISSKYQENKLNQESNRIDKLIMKMWIEQ